MLYHQYWTLLFIKLFKFFTIFHLQTKVLNITKKSKWWWLTPPTTRGRCASHEERVVWEASGRDKNIRPLSKVFSLHPVFSQATDTQATLDDTRSTDASRQNDSYRNSQKSSSSTDVVSWTNNTSSSSSRHDSSSSSSTTANNNYSSRNDSSSSSVITSYIIIIIIIIINNSNNSRNGSGTFLLAVRTNSKEEIHSEIELTIY